MLQEISEPLGYLFGIEDDDRLRPGFGVFHPVTSDNPGEPETCGTMCSSPASAAARSVLVTVWELRT
jgi:hypothetical protein